MDRTTDFVKITVLFDSGVKKPPTHHPLSQDARRAQQIADQLRQQELILRDLQELVTKKSIIGDDSTAQIATLTDVLKKELNTVEKNIQTFQQAINMQRGRHQQHHQAHFTIICASLKSRFAKSAKQFHQALQQHTNAIRERSSRRSKFSHGGASPMVHINTPLFARTGATPQTGMLRKRPSDPTMQPLLNNNGTHTNGVNGVQPTPLPSNPGSSANFGAEPGTPMQGAGLRRRVGNLGSTPFMQQQRFMGDGGTQQAMQYYPQQDAQTRYENAKQVESTIVEITGMYTRMATMVAEQGEIISRIDDDMGIAKTRETQQQAGRSSTFPTHQRTLEASLDLDQRPALRPLSVYRIPLSVASTPAASGGATGEATTTTAVVASTGRTSTPSSSGTRTPPIQQNEDDGFFSSARLKSPWKSEPRNSRTHRHRRNKSGGGGGEEGGERKSLLESIFSSKRKPSSVSTVPPTLRLHKPAPNPAAIERGVEILRSIFPKWEPSTLQVVLEVNEFIMEETITAILKMEEAEETNKRAAEGDALKFPVKNPLPDDFLRLPDDDDDDDAECARTDDEEEGMDMSGEYDRDQEEKGEKVARDDEECEDDQSNGDTSEKSSVLAEDDGTLYGKEFGSDEEELEEEGNLPVFAGEANQQIVSDSMNQKFIPAELRNEKKTIFDTTHIEAIKKSKLDLTEAENRIRHREPHLVFELLSKASEIYRSGVISSQELDVLRAQILSRIQPTKMLMDMTMNMDGIISDHEWHLLILHAKGIRQALSIRIYREEHKPKRTNGHMEYIIRVVDVESGVVWSIRKRFRELHKLYRKLSRLSGRVNECEFPTRRSHSRNSANVIAHDRAPVLENFLRTTAALVTPSPLTFLHGVALKQLQQFLEVPHVGILQRNRTQPISRELRVFVYHTVNDITSPEGKACTKFLAKLRHCSADSGRNLLEEIGDILDGVQEYMLEHRFEEMQLHVHRLVKYFSTMDTNQQSRMGRKNSFVQLHGSDLLGNHDKLQQLISDAIRHELEERICVPLMYDLIQYLHKRVMQKEQQFRQRVFQLKGKPQSYFGIGIDKISISSWRSVVNAIKEMDDAFLPLDKMRKLVAAAHSIHALYKTERQVFNSELPQRRHSRALGSSPPVSAPVSLMRHSMFAHSTERDEEQQMTNQLERSSAASSAHDDREDVLSGDDFLPIFIYVIVHSELEAPIMTQMLLNRLCDPEKRRSEYGYYLATYEAALHHILSREIFDADQQ